MIVNDDKIKFEKESYRLTSYTMKNLKLNKQITAKNKKKS